MSNKYEKRDWLIRASDIFNYLDINIIYNATNVRNFLRSKCNDAVSVPTIEKLLLSIIKAQEQGLQFKVKNKIRKLLLKVSATDDKLYELIEL
jgi:hypothetical protein